MLHTQSEERTTVFYSYLACFRNTFVLHVYVFLSNAGFIRQNTVFVFLWRRPGNA